MTSAEGVWREHTADVLAALLRRSGDFGACEDVVQEALLAAAEQWPREGRPDDPKAWLVRVASRRLIDTQRSAGARERREEEKRRKKLFEEEPIPERILNLIENELRSLSKYAIPGPSELRNQALEQAKRRSFDSLRARPGATTMSDVSREAAHAYSRRRRPIRAAPGRSHNPRARWHGRSDGSGRGR